MPRTTNHQIIRALTKGWALAFLALAAFACGTGVAGSPDTEPSTNTNPETSAAEISSKEETITATSPDAEVFFPQQPAGVTYGMALLRGRLILDDKGCIRAVDQGAPRMLVWPASFELSVEGDRVRVLDGKGRLVEQVGKKVNLGGGEASREIIEQNGLKDGHMLPELFRRCPGPYWLVAPGSVSAPRQN